MLNLNVNVVMKNVHDVLPHMIERRAGDIIVTSSLAAHRPAPMASENARESGSLLEASEVANVIFAWSCYPPISISRNSPQPQRGACSVAETPFLKVMSQIKRLLGLQVKTSG